MHRNKTILSFLLVLGLGLAIGPGRSALAQDGDDEEARQAFFDRIDADVKASLDDPEATAMGATPCVGGFAGPYACENVDLLAFMPLSSIGGGSGNDIWGWTDPLDGKEYAVMGRSSGTSFVDISDPVNPVYLGNLPTHTSNSSWRDIKVYADHAFIVSEAGGHGMQVFDLTRLRDVTNPPETFTEDGHYSGFGSAHNLVVNEDTGFAYGVGTSTCSGGLHFVNIQNPTSPTGAGCYSGDGYTHDAQCVVYAGPDIDWQGDEVCFAYNEDTLTIVNVTVKNTSFLIKKQGYTGSGYTHQGWVTEDQTYLLLDDELDELNFGHNTRTRVFDISDLDNPVLLGFFDAVFDAIDHNQYIRDGYAYQSNYSSGLQILDLAKVGAGSLSRAGYFDTYSPNNNASFNGTWSNYPYFDSGVVVISDINSGLFIVQPILVTAFLDFTPGWNLLTLPIDPLGSFTAQSFLDNINGQAGECGEIYRWLNGGWDGHVDGFPFNDFAIEMGRGYFVLCSGPGTMYYNGTAFSTGVTIELDPGWNLVGIPYPPESYSAQTLLDAANTPGGNCNEIDRWLNSGWDGFVNGFPFNDFDIASDEGYFLLCSASSSFTP